MGAGEGSEAVPHTPPSGAVAIPMSQDSDDVARMHRCRTRAPMSHARTSCLGASSKPTQGAWVVVGVGLVRAKDRAKVRAQVRAQARAWVRVRGQS